MKIGLGTHLFLLVAGLCPLAAHDARADAAAPDVAMLEFDGDELVVPLDERAVHPIALVGIGDDATYRFVVDTGAEVNVIDTSLAEDYPIIGETAVGAPGGAQVAVNIVRVPEMRIGNGVLRDAEFVTLDIRTMTGGLMDGVIGMGSFQELLLTFDRGQNRIHVAREALSPGDAGTMPYSDTGGHIHIDVDVAGTPVATHIDTGSMAGFTLPVELMEELPLMDDSGVPSSARLVGGARNVQRARLDGSIVLAGARYENPMVGFMDPSPGYGNIGSAVLRDFAVSIDQRNRLIRFRQNAAETSADSAPRRLGVEFRGQPGGDLTVGNVESGSLGEEHGVQPGDVVVAVNGKATGDYDIQDLGALIRGSDPLTLEIRRDGNPVTIEIP